MPEENNKKKKLSQEEIKLSNLANRFIRQISIATKNFRTFGEGHPLLKNNIQNAHELLMELLFIKDSVTFTFIGETCVVEDMPLKEADLKTSTFVATAAECGITSLTFLQGIGEEELYLLLKILSGGQNAIKAESGLSNYLQRKNITTIKTDEIFFKRVSVKEEEEKDAKRHLEDFLVMNYLLGKTAISKDEIESLVGEITVNPKRMGKIISNIATTYGSQGPAQNKGAVSGEIEEAGSTDGVEFARSSIEKFAIHIKNVQGKADPDIAKHIENLIMALDPSIRGAILKSRIRLPGGSDDIVKDIITELSDEIIVELVVSDFVEKKTAIVQIRKLIERLLPDISRRKRALPLIEKRLLQKGVPQNVCSKILEEKFWSDMDVEEKIKKVLGEEPLFCAEIGLADEIEKLIKDLFVEKNFDGINNVLDKVLANFRSEDTGFKIRLIRDFGNIFTLLFQTKDYPYKEKLLIELKDEFKKTKSPELKKHFSKIFIDATRLCLGNRWYSYLASLVNTLGYENVKSEVFPEGDIEKLFKDILFDEKSDRRLLSSLSREIGKEAIFSLRNILMSILPDDFDSYRRRYIIAMVLKELGENTEDIFINDLSSENSDILKNALEALSEIATDRAVSHIEKLLDHKKTIIQKHAAVALKHIKGRTRS